MKNKEKYADEIMESFADNKRCSFVRKHILKEEHCDRGIDCADCHSLTKNWLEKEYKPPCIHWKKVPVNTPLYVWDSPGEGEKPRKLVKHFSRYEPKEDKIYCWMNGGCFFYL